MTIPVFYRPEQVASAQGFSPSAAKPKLVVEDWLKCGLAIDVHAFNPVSRDTLARSHAPAYVDGIFDGTIPNGFGTRSAEVAASLPYTVGSIVAAAKHVLREPERGASLNRIACSPTSGFHHAHHARAEGFCTFNGLIVAAMELKRFGLAERIGILDMDQHHGNGTDHIIEKLGLDYIVHLTHGVGLDRDPKENGSPSLRNIVKRNFIDSPRSTNVTKVGRGYYCDILLYQAGADAHINDPLGGYLSTEQMQARDEAVFWTCEQYELPLVWNLAGGYQRTETGGIEPVLNLHRNTMKACIAQYEGAGT